MRRSNLSAQVAPFILAGLRRMAAEQGVSVDQLVNLALGRFVASHREPELLARGAEAGRDPGAARAAALAVLGGLGSDGEVPPGGELDADDPAQAIRRAS